jgi:hypothetical protein
VQPEPSTPDRVVPPPPAAAAPREDAVEDPVEERVAPGQAAKG